jgi:ABC-type sugar transport system substrate-binding protein
MRHVEQDRARWLLAVALATTIGCSHSEQSPSEPPSGPTGYTIGVCMANLDTPRQQQIKADIEAEAQKYADAKLIFFDAKDNSEQLRLELDKLRKEKVSAVIVNPTDPQFLVEPIARLFEANIPVVVLDRPVIGNAYSCYIAPDPKQLGAEAAKWLAERLQGKGNIVELRGPVDSYAADQLHAAFRAGLRDPGYRFVYDVHVDPPKVDAGDMMHKVMADVDKIDAVFGYDDAAAKDAYDAAKSDGREKGTLFIGVGGLPQEGAVYVAQKYLVASVLDPTGGAEAVDTVMKLLRGKEIPKKIVPATRMIAEK